MQSEAIGELAAALAKAHAEITPPTKGKTAKIESQKGSYSYKYADLADVIECYKAPLSKHGLAIAQTMKPDGGLILLTTTLLHSSGQWIGSDYPIASYPRPQEQGSAITYARRYAVTALLGIAAEDDDDGAAAQHAKARDEEPPSVHPDVSAILDLAAEIQQRNGKSIDAIVSEASTFEKDGKTNSFSDPQKAISRPKWLASTRRRLEGEAVKLRALHEPGNEPPF